MKTLWENYGEMAGGADAGEAIRGCGAGGTELLSDRDGGHGEVNDAEGFIRDSIKRVDLTPPTGVAALNVGGMTIHRFCGLMLGPQPGQSNEDYFEVLRRDPRRSILAGFNRVRRRRVTSSVIFILRCLQI